MNGSLSLTRFISQCINKSQIPGAVIGIVKDGKPILCECFGVRNVEKNLAVTPNSNFLICSLTKAFTVLSAMLLVEKGKLDLDKPILSYLPWFKLQDSLGYTLTGYVAEEIAGLPWEAYTKEKILFLNLRRDLFCHWKDHLF